MLRREYIQEILAVLYEEQCIPQKKPRPVTLTDIRKCQFFRMYNNRFIGWFVTVIFFNRPAERWFAVLTDEDWHLERVD